jgi:hypothetical protein
VLTFDEAEVTIEHAFARQLQLFDTLWRYRFFFGSMDVVLTQSLPLYQHYVGFQHWVLRKIAHAVSQFVDWGHLKQIELPNTPDLVAANSWVIWIGWVRWEMITYANNGKDADAEAIAVTLRVLRRNLGYQYPFQTPDFAVRITELLKEEAERHGVDPFLVPS